MLVIRKRDSEINHFGRLRPAASAVLAFRRVMQTQQRFPDTVLLIAGTQAPFIFLTSSAGPNFYHPESSAESA
jgi:hypothetical protein